MKIKHCHRKITRLSTRPVQLESVTVSCWGQIDKIENYSNLIVIIMPIKDIFCFSYLKLELLINYYYLLKTRELGVHYLY